MKSFLFRFYRHCRHSLLVSSVMLLVSMPVLAANLTPYSGKKLHQANQLQQNGDLNKAIEVLAGFTPSSDYDKAFVGRLLGIYYWQAEQPQQSIRSLKAALALQALEPQAQWQTQRMLGDILYAQHDFSAAVMQYRQVLSIKYQPKMADKAQYTRDINQLNFRIAAAYYQQQNWSQVRQFIGRYQAPDNKQALQALRMQVVAELRLKRWSDAEKTLSHLLRLEPNNKGWWQQLIAAQLQQSKSSAALSSYSLAKQQGVEFNAADYQSLAQLYGQNHIPERAARILQQMFELYPDSKTVANQKTQANYWQIAREWDKAIAAWQALARRDGQYYWPLTQLLIQQKRYQQAAEAIDKAEPYAKAAEFGLAKIQLLYRLKHYDDALATAKRLDEKQPSAAAKTWINFLQNKLRS